MQYFWLNNKEENKKLIVFFNGWAMNETPIQHLECDDYNVLVIYDYRDFNFDFSEFNLKKYLKKYLIAWSMGVCACNLFYDILNNFDKKIAINGTTKIVDDNLGIPCKIYKATQKFLNEANCDKFIKNMFDNGNLNHGVTITRPIEELRDEMSAIQNISFDKQIEFDKAIISEDDRIIPTKNQLHFWRNKTEISYIHSTHCPFENYSSFKELICQTKT